MGKEEFLVGAKKLVNRKAKKLEVDVENCFVAYAKGKGCKAVKLVLVALRGFPDRTILCPGGRVFFIEFKRSSSDKLAANQVKWKKILERLGFEHHVCWNLEDSKEKLDEFLLF